MGLHEDPDVVVGPDVGRVTDDLCTPRHAIAVGRARDPKRGRGSGRPELNEQDQDKCDGSRTQKEPKGFSTLRETNGSANKDPATCQPIDWRASPFQPDSPRRWEKAYCSDRDTKPLGDAIGGRHDATQ
jgi:hypothetical protein